MTRRNAHYSVYLFAFGLMLLGLFSTGCGEKPPSPVTVVMATNVGDITLELYPANAPQTVENFLTYVREGFYNGVLFHRVIPMFAIQAGGYDEFLKLKQTHDPIKNESPTGLLNEKYTIAMARSGDPHSATSQFYINLKHNVHLDEGYAVFGRVTEGMELVDAISKRYVQNLGGAFTDLPLEPVIITEMRIEE